MSHPELEQQLLTLDLADRIRLLQVLAQSLTEPPSSQPADELELKRDRTPNHPLRTIPLTIPPDFDEPMTDLWDALEQ
jgi:hypothetical protein